MEYLQTFFAQYGALLAQGTWDTIVMSLVSTALAYVIGIPLGVFLVLTDPKKGLLPHKAVNAVLGWIVNIGRSIPFIILLVAIIPFTRLVVGTSLGVPGAVVPLVVAAAPFVGRMVEQSLAEVDAGLARNSRYVGLLPALIGSFGFAPLAPFAAGYLLRPRDAAATTLFAGVLALTLSGLGSHVLSGWDAFSYALVPLAGSVQDLVAALLVLPYVRG